MAIPAPGSHAAVRLGCKCNMLANQLGLGIDRYKRMFVISDECTMHQRDHEYLMPPSALTPTERRIARQKAIVQIENSIEKIRAATMMRRRIQYE